MGGVTDFIAAENNAALKAEVQAILQDDYDRLGLVDALLHALRKYELELHPGALSSDEKK